MTPSLPIILSILAGPPATMPCEFRPVAPEALVRNVAQTKTNRTNRAAILIHGMKLFPVRPQRANVAELHDWQEPTGELPKLLAPNFDVYAFAYAQIVPLDAVAHTPELRAAVAQLRKKGYSEIVLIGHSCGGVIARQFVEAYPETGVTKVIQVAAPNLGSDLAFMNFGYHRIQSAIVESCRPPVRQAMIDKNRRLIPPKVEFATVVCKIPSFDGDVLVWMDAAWPDDLQRQGIPATLIGINHFDAMKGPAGVKVIAELANEKLTRWSPEQVEQARKVLFRKPEKANVRKPR